MFNPETKVCQNCKNEFIIEPEDFLFYEKMKVPAPTWCWRCRAMRRMSFRNIDHLYDRTCAATGKKIFTLMPPDAPMPVYSPEYWASDAWDPTKYGREYDFSKPFFEQIRDLFNTVPWSNVWTYGSVNSDYGEAVYAKNCYLCFDTGFVEDSAYSVTLLRSKQCLDMLNCKGCELCYFCINTNDSYKTFFSRNCTSCVEVWFSQDCVGCNNCFGCTGLRNKSYYIFNKSYTKESYEEKLQSLHVDSWSGLKKAQQEAWEIWGKYPVKYQHSVKADGCTGDYIYNSDRLKNCFFAGNAQNCFHSQSIIYGPIKDSADITSSGEVIELFYETSDSGDQASKIFFSFSVAASTDCQYVANCRQSSNLFGCVGLRGKNYCILNRQYSKEEYGYMISKIVDHMNALPYRDSKDRIYKYGEFFPLDMSPFGYNETQAYEYFPLNKKQAESQGYHWQDFVPKKYDITKTSRALSDTVSDVGDDITKEIIQCLHDEEAKHPFQCDFNCATAFRITPQELQFYRQLNMPLPRTCFYCRHFERIAWRNKPQLWYRRCNCAGLKSENGIYQNQTTHFHKQDHCPNEFETSYAPERKEIVYCEECYQQEVV